MRSNHGARSRSLKPLSPYSVAQCASVAAGVRKLDVQLTVVLPPTGPLLLTIVGLAVLARFPRGGRLLAASGVFILLALSTPAVSAVLVRLLDGSAPFDPLRAENARAIVILGGGIRRHARGWRF